VIYVVRYLLVALCTVFWGTFGLILFPLARRGSAVMFVARNWVAWMLACCGVRVEPDGLENLSEPVVIMSNHQSVFDIAALIYTLPLEWRFVAKKELLWIPFFGWALAAADQVIIDRSDREKSVRSLRRAAERVRRFVGIDPGSRDGEIGVCAEHEQNRGVDPIPAGDRFAAAVLHGVRQTVRRVGPQSDNSVIVTNPPFPGNVRR